MSTKREPTRAESESSVKWNGVIRESKYPKPPNALSAGTGTLNIRLGLPTATEILLVSSGVDKSAPSLTVNEPKLGITNLKIEFMGETTNAANATVVFDQQYSGGGAHSVACGKTIPKVVP